MTATVALLTITALAVRQIRRARTFLLADPVDQHDRSWCACDCGDTPEPCSSTIRYDGTKTCVLLTGHDGLHEHGGWRWSDSFAEDAA